MATDSQINAEPTRGEIAVRAYQIFLERGCQHGHDVDDWLQAEYELRKLPVRVLASLDPPKSKRHKPEGKSLLHVVRLAVFGLSA